MDKKLECLHERQRNVVLNLLTLAKYVTAHMDRLEQSEMKCTLKSPLFSSPSSTSRVNGCEQTLLIHERSQLYLHEGQPAQQNRRMCHHLQSPSDPPSLTGGGENFKGQRKWKGTLFSRPECRTYQGCASAQNQPGLLDMLKRQSRLETGGEDQTWGEKQRQIRWTDATERNSRQIRLARPHLCKSHNIFPFTYF